MYPRKMCSSSRDLGQGELSDVLENEARLREKDTSSRRVLSKEALLIAVFSQSEEAERLRHVGPRRADTWKKYSLHRCLLCRREQFSTTVSSRALGRAHYKNYIIVYYYIIDRRKFLAVREFLGPSAKEPQRKCEGNAI
jgi:hypothetical protein